MIQLMKSYKIFLLREHQIFWKLKMCDYILLIIILIETLRISPSCIFSRGQKMLHIATGGTKIYIYILPIYSKQSS